jgi:hypothetical protein
MGFSLRVARVASLKRLRAIVTPWKRIERIEHFTNQLVAKLCDSHSSESHFLRSSIDAAQQG